MTTQTSKMVQIAGRQIAMNGALIQIETAAGAAWIPLKHADRRSGDRLRRRLARVDDAHSVTRCHSPAFTFFARDWLYERTVQTEDGPEHLSTARATSSRRTVPAVAGRPLKSSGVTRSGATSRSPWASELAERMKAQTRDGASFDPEAAGWASTTPCHGSHAYDAAEVRS